MNNLEKAIPVSKESIEKESLRRYRKSSKEKQKDYRNEAMT